MAEQYFHFTLGPVQGFVAQARRTRDFWAGSFLLSWLSGVAMCEVIRQGGEITFPIPADGYLDWITGSKMQGEPPRQGGIPNRFKAFSAKVPENFDGALVAATIRDAWCALAGHVWNKDELDGVATGHTRAIWDRQHRQFWEISWAITSDKEASALLDQRKNWRAHFPPAEDGVKCMVMDGYQELSGAERPGQEVSAFWQKVRGNGVRAIQTDLVENEHLCALAYVKRRFVRHFESFRTTLDSGLSLRGWKLAPGIPSVSYMAAVHWLEQLVTTATAAELQDIVDAAYDAGAGRDEWDTHIHCLREACHAEMAADDRRQLLAFDGNLFFEHVQDNARQYGYKPDRISILQRLLRNVRQVHAEFDEPLSPFYAVLLMDGDSLGVHMSDPDKQKPISKALNTFTARVPQVVERHNGFLIYAGGDDVLALLPLEDAIGCAAAVRTTYLDCFKAHPTINTSISAAIEYAHVKIPLGKVLSDAHHLLDEVAKDGAGRDALAVRVWKPGGLALEWAQPWCVALDADGCCIINGLAREFRAGQARYGSAFSSKFFYKIRERFDLLNPARQKDGRYGEPVLDAATASALLAMDFKNSADNRELTLQEAEHVIAPLLGQCRAVTRDMTQPVPERWARSPLLRPDGALLVRFLAQKGVEQ
ncbi:type III-B CRISPR-associated protein Cas10/Cmr2 [Laribacter hongkongensis]|uniref:type III-B CRISPR-associated protein Cas10/Cmr2 n=1 Tax=Laribacter hongkongensis TaxID=168471 RepID=UPI001EFEA4B5|nr:type III-B CRISPR-associated protein Cas10/Cmr2 [Laribacter hongkongensis]MCG9059806.1 type III-B CRISPR-associated protein Cas10/Cmr2 [Laribacter hongkongensis]MCG9086546.1 type III-B CRISPR-associated protein Cas10/Cmr2 [Laribacter hongkongensis]